MSKKIDLRSEFEAAIARLNPVRGGLREYRVATKIGPLDFCLYPDEEGGGWIAAGWADVEAAKKHFGVTVTLQGRLNPYSGKWNWHWQEFADGNVRRLREAGRNRVARHMVDSFVETVQEAV